MDILYKLCVGIVADGLFSHSVWALFLTFCIGTHFDAWDERCIALLSLRGYIGRIVQVAFGQESRLWNMEPRF